MFLFRGGDMSKMSPQQQQEQMGKWLAWVDKLKKENRYEGGEPLLPAGKVVSGPKRTITDGPYAESKEIVGGFFIVTAKNLDDAMSMTKDYPDYDLGGSIEVREVMKLE